MCTLERISHLNTHVGPEPPAGVLQRNSPSRIIAVFLYAIAPAASSSAVSGTLDRASCAVAVDPYSLPEGALARCGVGYYPLRTYPLPAGGTAYVYRVEGALTTYYVPRARFNPYLASPAVRSAYDIQDKPASGSGLRQWTLLSQHPDFVTPPPFIASAPASTILGSIAISKGNWGGTTHSPRISGTRASRRCGRNRTIFPAPART
jgi:hypothetical protein